MAGQTPTRQQREARFLKTLLQRRERRQARRNQRGAEDASAPGPTLDPTQDLAQDPQLPRRSVPADPPAPIQGENENIDRLRALQEQARRQTHGQFVNLTNARPPNAARPTPIPVPSPVANPQSAFTPFKLPEEQDFIMPNLGAPVKLNFPNAVVEESYKKYLGYRKFEKDVERQIKDMLDKPLGISDSDLLKVALAEFVDLGRLNVGPGDIESSDFAISASGSLEIVKKSTVHHFSTWPAFMARLDVLGNAIIRFYPERKEELTLYNSYLLRLERVDPMTRVIAFDAACRRRVASRKNITLNMFNEFSDIYNEFINPPTGVIASFGNNQRGATKKIHAPKPLGEQRCRNWNQDRCNNAKCPRQHVCLRCAGEHTISQCTQPPKGQAAAEK